MQRTSRLSDRFSDTRPGVVSETGARHESPLDASPLNRMRCSARLTQNMGRRISTAAQGAELWLSGFSNSSLAMRKPSRLLGTLPPRRAHAWSQAFAIRTPVREVLCVRQWHIFSAHAGSRTARSKEDNIRHARRPHLKGIPTVSGKGVA